MSDIKRSHANFPFTDDARRVIHDSNTPILTVINNSPEVVERAYGRVERAVTDATVGPAYSNTQISPTEEDKIELYSYPVARALVSATGHDELVGRYAKAEAQRAVSLLKRADSRGRGVGLENMLSEFDISLPDGELTDNEGQVAPSNDINLLVTDYIRWVEPDADEQWSLVCRPVSGGQVTVSVEEVYEVARRAIKSEVSDGLPAQANDQIVAALSDEISQLNDLIGDHNLTVPDSHPSVKTFPPCMQRLFDTAVGGGKDGPALDRRERFVLFSFLDYIGAEDLIDGCNPSEFEQKAISKGAFVPPGYSALIAAGICDEDEADPGEHPIADYRHRRKKMAQRSSGENA